MFPLTVSSLGTPRVVIWSFHGVGLIQRMRCTFLLDAMLCVVSSRVARGFRWEHTSFVEIIPTTSIYVE